MPKSFPANIATEVAKQFASEPLLLVEVDWGLGVKLYCDRDFYTAEGRILELSTLDNIVKVAGSSSVATATCKLSDTDGYIKDVLGSVDIHKRPAKVYLTYGNLTLADKYLILDGEINTPIEWNDTDRTFTFDIVSKIETTEVGFSPEQSDLDYVAESAIGKAWPLCFGSPLHVPAAKITERVQGRAKFQVSFLSAGTVAQICALAKQQREYYNLKVQADTPGPTLVSETNYIAILEALNSATTSLTQAKESALTNSDNVRRGQINNLIQTCGDLREAELEYEFANANAAVYSAEVDAADQSLASLNQQLSQATDAGDIAALTASIAAVTASRNASAINKISAETEATAASVTVSSLTAEAQAIEDSLIRITLPTMVIEDGEKFPQGETVTININGMRFVGTFNGETFTVTEDGLVTTPSQYGTTEYSGSITLEQNEFSYAQDIKGMYGWTGNGLIYITNWINGRAIYVPALYRKTGEISLGPITRDTYDFRTISGPGTVSRIVRPDWLATLRAQDANGSNPAFASGLSNIQYSDFSINYGDTVYLDGNYQEKYVANLIPSTEIHEVLAYRIVDGAAKLTPVPSSYYTTSLSEEIAGQTVTSITLNQPIEDYPGEEWQPGIFVSLTSSVGPNTADIMKWLVDTYGTDLTADASSFSTLATKLTNYPSHFALLQKQNLLSTIEEIAWQARCAAYVRNGVLYAKYLAEEEAAVETIDSSTNIQGSLVLALSSTEDLVTVFRGKWKREYSQQEESEVVIRNNIPKYGTIEKDFQFSIYNIESLVVKSATFWSIRYSNTWKRARLKGVLQHLAIDEFDTVALDFPDNIFASSSVKGMVESVTFDSNSKELEFDIWLAVRPGELTQYLFAWPATTDPGDEYPDASDLYAGS